MLIEGLKKKEKTLMLFYEGEHGLKAFYVPLCDCHNFTPVTLLPKKDNLSTSTDKKTVVYKEMNFATSLKWNCDQAVVEYRPSSHMLSDKM